MTRRSASVKSVWYRVTVRLCFCRVVGVHMANPSWFKKPLGITAGAQDSNFFENRPWEQPQGPDFENHGWLPRDRPPPFSQGFSSSDIRTERTGPRCNSSPEDARGAAIRY